MTHKPYIGFYFPLVAEYRRNRTKFEILRLGFKYKCGLLPTVCLVRVLLCLTLCNPMDYSPPGSPVHGISQASTLQWVAIPFSRGFSWPRDGTSISCIQFSSVQSLSHVWFFAIPWIAFCPSPTPWACSNSCPSSQWCHPTISSSVSFLLLPPSILPSTRVFSDESVLLIRWPKYWSFRSCWKNFFSN